MISHPLKEQTVVVRHQPVCPCTGMKYKEVQGKILQTYNYPTGIWYYLDSGVTVKSDWIVQVIN